MQLSRVQIDGRRWYRGPDGTLYPTASSVLDILFPGSKDWINEDALVRGTMCHSVMARALVNRVQRNLTNEEEISNGIPPEEVDGILHRVKAGIEWLNKFHFETIAVESPIGMMGVGMTPDLVVREIDPNGNWVKHLLDWKFAETVIDQYFFQVELYARAEEAQKATIVQIDRKGNVFPHRVRPEPERWELIKSAINVRHHIDRKEKRYA